MEKHRAKVVMLPVKYKTEEEKVNNSALIVNNKDKSLTIIDGLMRSLWKSHQEFGDFKAQGIYQHLYITTDEEIKEGDYWIYVCPINGVDHGDDNNPITKNNLPSSWFEKLHDRKNYHKIIATTDKSLKGVAQPSQAFIEKYCKEGGIDEVLVEYNKHFIRTEKNVAFGIISKWNYTLKVDSHNTITIHPIKDSWNRQEVRQAILDYGFTVTGEGDIEKNLDEWIKENL